MATPVTELHIDGLTYEFEGEYTTEQAYQLYKQAEANGQLPELTPEQQRTQLLHQQDRIKRELAQATTALDRAEDFGGSLASSAKQRLSQIGAGIGASVTSLVGTVADGIAWANRNGPGAETARAVGDAMAGRRDELRTFAHEASLERARYLKGELTEEDKRKAVEDGEMAFTIAETMADVGGAVATGLGTQGVALVAGGAKGVPAVLGGIGLGAAEGALTAALFGGDSNLEEAEDRFASKFGEMSAGAALGGAFGAVTGIAGAALGSIGKQIEKHKHLMGDIEDMSDEFGIAVTWGELTGSPWLRRMEALAAGDETQVALRDRSNEVATKLAKAMGITFKGMDQAGEASGGPLAALAEAARSHVISLKEGRNVAFRNTMQVAEEVSGGAPILKPKGAAQTAIQILDEFKGRGYQFNAGAKRIMDDIIEGADTGLSPRRINEMLSDLAEMKSGGGQSFKFFDVGPEGQGGVMAARLRTALNDSIDTADDLGNPKVKQALDFVKQARSNYRDATRGINQIEGELLSGVMGQTPRQIAQFVKTADVSTVRGLAKFIEQMDGGPALKRKIVNALYDDAVVQGMQAAIEKGEAAGDLDIGAFTDALARTPRQSFLKGLVSEDEADKMSRAIGHMRRLLNNPAMSNPYGIVTEKTAFNIGDVAINAVSRDPGFMARLFANTLRKGQTAEHFLSTPAGQRQLAAMAGANTVRSGQIAATRNAATMGVINMLNLQSEGADDHIRDERVRGQR